MSVVEDLQYRTFGLLTVLRYAGIHASHHRQWVCRCVCGEEPTIRASHLHAGQHSCGCQQGAHHGHPLEDLTGHPFGLLTVMTRIGPDKNGAILWRCHCLCGNETVARANNLRDGNTRSCGCNAGGTGGVSRLQSLPGQIFGMLQVLSGSYDRPTRTMWWRCLCQCGMLCSRTTRDLSHRKKQLSCDVCRRERGYAVPRRERLQALANISA